MASLVPFRRIINQINPFDNGRTYKQLTPTNNNSVVQQATHNGVTNAVGGIVKPLVRSSLAINQGFGNAQVAAAHALGLRKDLQIQNAQQFANDTIGANANKVFDYKGTKKQIVGDAISNVANVAFPSSSKIVTGAATKVLPKAVPSIVSKVVSSAAVGAPAGAVGNIGGYIADSDKLTVKGAGQAAKTGAIYGAAGGAAIPLAAPVAKAVVNTTSPIIKQTAKAIQDEQRTASVRKSAKQTLINEANRSERAAQQLIKRQDKYPDQSEVIQRQAQQLLNRADSLRASIPKQSLPQQISDRVLTARPGLSIEDVSKRPTVGEAKAVLQKQPVADNTPVNINDYLKSQIKSQEVARKAGDPTGFGKVSAAGREFKTKLIDSLSPIEDTLNQKITPANATNHITPQLDRAIRADTIAGQYVRDNGLDKVIQGVDNTKSFDQYLIAKHAADLEKNGIKTGRNSAADAELVKQLDGKYGAQAAQVQKYSQDLLDKAADYGLISKELAASLKQKYPNYVPANRIFGENELPTFKGTGSGKASIGTQTVVQKIKGSDRAIESPLDSILQKTRDVIEQGERNKAAQILTGYKDLPGNPFHLRELAKDEQVGNKHVISVLQDGKKVQFETTKEIADAAKSLSREQLGLVGKILSYPTRILRLGATTLNPAFTGANIVKDLASGALNSKNPFRSSVANPTVFIKALGASFNHGSKAYQELVREGAGGTSFDIARNAAVENVAKIRAQKNFGTRIKYTVTHPSQLLRAAEDTIGRSEEFSRALQYFGGKQANLAKGASEEAARILGAHAARNNTINFARAGDYGRVLNSVLPYLNAGIQGARTFVRNAGDNPGQFVSKIVILGSVPTATVTAWNISSPDRKAAYDDIKDYEKQGNLIIVPPNPVKDPTTNKWNVIKIPVSQELANLNNIVRNGIESLNNDKNFDFKAMAGDLIGTTTSLQVESPRQLLGQVTPQAVKPALESIVNQNLFTGNKIVPDSQQHLDPRDQYGKTTSGTAKVLGNLTNQSPRKIDNAIRTGAAGLGQNLINVSDNVLAKTGLIKPEDIRGTSFGSSIEKRFSGATGSGPYDVIDKTTEDLTKKLKATQEYKSMSPEEKAKALNRLSSQVTNTYTTDKKLSPKQQAIAEGNANVKDYLQPSKKGGKQTTINSSTSSSSKKVLDQYDNLSAEERTKKSYSQNDYDYQVAVAKYENARNNGTLSAAQDIKQRASIDREKVGAAYSKDTRDLYGLTKQQIYSYITTNRNGAQLAKDLQDYDQRLYDAGIITSKKFKNGFTSTKTTTGRSGSRSNGGVKFKTSSLPRISGNRFKTPRLKIAKVRTPAVKTKKAVYRSGVIASNAQTKLKARTA